MLRHVQVGTIDNFKMEMCCSNLWSKNYLAQDGVHITNYFIDLLI
jgi:hypothetical protein